MRRSKESTLSKRFALIIHSCTAHLRYWEVVIGILRPQTAYLVAAGFESTASFLFHRSKKTVFLASDAIILCSKRCARVTIPTPFSEFSERSLYRARITFLWGREGATESPKKFWTHHLSHRPVISLTFSGGGILTDGSPSN